MNRTRPYKILLEYYLRNEVYGYIGSFNKKYFPVSWEDMKKELEELIEEKNV